jgi:hypothetical protein
MSTDPVTFIGVLMVIFGSSMIVAVLIARCWVSWR